MATDASTSREPTADLVRLGALHAALVAVPVLVLAVVLPAWLAVLLALIAGVAATVARAGSIDARVAASLGARPVAAGERPRYAGVVESTAMAVGASPPVLHVIEDPARNAVVWGSGLGACSIAVTTGLLESAELIELEAVVAHLLTDLRDGTVEAATVAAGLLGPLAAGPLARPVARLVRAGQDERRVALADMEAARATQYPPGAVAALERVRGGVSSVVRSPRVLQPLWFAAPAEPDAEDPFAVHPPLADRIDLLREL